MQIHREELTDVNRYLASQGAQLLEEKQTAFDNYLRYVRKGCAVTPQTRMLEVGTGTGWFPILCNLKGLHCEGLEISPQLVDHARQLGAQYGIEPEIRLGNLERADLGPEKYDVIVCSSVFEHVEFWREGLAKVYAALKPGGVLFWESTNKFSFTSGEYRKFPLYGWLPDALRYRLRIAVHGPDIMKLGIDFHQFTYFSLRRHFRRMGFAKVMDRFDVFDTARVTGAKRLLAALSRSFPPLKHLILTFFVETTTFVCVKPN